MASVLILFLKFFWLSHLNIPGKKPILNGFALGSIFLDAKIRQEAWSFVLGGSIIRELLDASSREVEGHIDRVSGHFQAKLIDYIKIDLYWLITYKQSWLDKIAFLLVPLDGKQLSWGSSL